MANNKEKTYWPHMIVGFLIIGITLGYWTVKSAASMPVQESNEYMLKYQIADMNINEIMQKKIVFDKEYKIQLRDVKTMVMKNNINSNRSQVNPIELKKGLNEFHYEVLKSDGSIVSDANVTFLLTRPHTRVDDKLVESVPFIDGIYQIKGVEIVKPGRYTLQLRVQIKDAIGYSEVPAYLKP